MNRINNNAYQESYNLQRRVNEFLVLDAVRNNQPIGKSSIANITKLSRATVDSCIKKLSDYRIVRDAGRDISRGGRRPALFTINQNSRYIAGVNLEVPGLTMVITDLNLKIVAEDTIKINSFGKRKEDIVQGIIKKLYSLLETSKIDKGKLLGIGIGVSGLVNKKNGISVSIERLPDWENVPLVDMLTDEFNVPILLENDANLVALAERTFGAGKGEDNLIFVSVRAGIGLGVIIGGEIYSGVSGNAGILGHTTLNEDGPLCTCGNHGCLEVYARESFIVERVKEKIRKGEDSLIKILSEGEFDKVNLELIFTAAHQKDILALETISEMGKYLGIGIADVVLLFDPGLIIIHGVMKGEDLLLNMIKKTVVQRTGKMLRRDVRIQYGKLGQEAPALGAAILVWESMFSLPQIGLLR